eukprot:TRINITY_DN8585_c0_g1_i1.p1 TRINITY_DN8585_c0_g1~~TRINITY_DN8585_c0_g1_i1.p1  ORF type:complete len:184 (-),score=30.82 TRINITY_DN8585_c0_g1_i1:123-674(-)
MAHISKENLAIVLVDVQDNFLGLPDFDVNFPQFKQNVMNLLDFARAEGIEVVHVLAEYNRDVSKWMDCWYDMKGTYDTILPVAANFASPVGDEKVFNKHTFNGFSNLELVEYLKTCNKKYLYIGGLITSACVLNTAFGAYFEGYRVSLIEDCCGDRSVERHNSIISIYGEYTFSIVNSKNIMV